MIRVVALLVLVALATQIAMLADTNAGTAILFSFLGSGVLGLAIALYAYSRWRPVRMSADERALYDLAFRDLGAREFVDLVVLGSWDEAEPGEGNHRPDGKNK